VFGLKPPAPPSAQPPAAPPRPKLFLTGISTMLGDKRVFLKAVFQSRPGEPAKEKLYMLSEGQRDGELEVLCIDEKARSVRMNEFGAVATLTFEKDGVKETHGPAALPAAAPPHLVRHPRGVVTAFAPPGSGAAGMITLPVPNQSPAEAATAQPPAAAPAQAQSSTPLPSAGIAQPPQLTPEEQAILLLELEREQNRSNPNYLPQPAPPNVPAWPGGRAGY
jgi:hypothetical protein